jgi:hypothetical protein
MDSMDWNFPDDCTFEELARSFSGPYWEQAERMYKRVNYIQIVPDFRELKPSEQARWLLGIREAACSLIASVAEKQFKAALAKSP